MISQRLDTLKGKVLRIDRATGEGVPGNPYFDPPSGQHPLADARAPAAGASRIVYPVVGSGLLVAVEGLLVYGRPRWDRALREELEARSEAARR